MNLNKLYFIQKYGQKWQKEYDRHHWGLHLDDIMRMATESHGRPDNMTLLMSPQNLAAYRALLGPDKVKIR